MAVTLEKPLPTCKRCLDATRIYLFRQRFANNKTHWRAECATCRNFLAYVEQNAQTVRLVPRASEEATRVFLTEDCSFGVRKVVAEVEWVGPLTYSESKGARKKRKRLERQAPPPTTN